MTSITICAIAEPALTQALSEQVERRISQGKYSQQELAYITRLDRSLFSKDTEISEDLLNRFRRLCLFSNVELHIAKISSHRKFIGPVIVAVKKITFPILKLLLKDFLRQQREFNAEVVTALAEVVGEKTNRPV